MTDELMALLPCPFCGGAPSMEPWHGGAPTKMMVACPSEESGCEVGPMVTGETPAEATAAWNRRTERPALIEREKALRRIVELADVIVAGVNEVKADRYPPLFAAMRAYPVARAALAGQP